jgi:hypothetical protein
MPPYSLTHSYLAHENQQLETFIANPEVVPTK